LGEVFYSTFEKPLDAKRRIVVPADFRTAAAGPFDGVFCFPSVEADCIEGGGKALFDRNEALINEFDVGDPLRYSLEFTLRGGMAQLAFDTAGRVTLPENLCEMFGLTDWVVVVGLGERFQIWARDAFHAERPGHRTAAREGLRARAALRRARMGAAE
jgi:MraZ protein